ncbi:hypothetical protein YC2023_116658 [Brassica napus]|uniref:Uncharacterized protein n=1 Tax=Brassica oleracea TaxID=3712 RepID=A0A3P6EES0_BRAOL|nr:unnamed protein product [Brassica oleracea]
MLFCFYSLIFKQVHEYFLLDVGKLADQIRYNYRITSLNKYPVGEIGLNQTKIEGCKGIVKTLCLSIWVQFPRILHPMKWLVLAKNGAPKLNEQSICALNPGSKKLICRKGIDYDYFESCFEVRKSLYDHQHDARRSDHIFNLAQLKDASEEDKTDSGLSQMAKILVHEVQHSIKLVTESENCWRALAWNTALNICNPLAFVVILLCTDRINYPLILTPLCEEAEDTSSDCYFSDVCVCFLFRLRYYRSMVLICRSKCLRVNLRSTIF